VLNLSSDAALTASVKIAKNNFIHVSNKDRDLGLYIRSHLTPATVINRLKNEMAFNSSRRLIPIKAG
jgi:hypothetical protein